MTRLADYCTTCNHPIHHHGDRAIGGTCTHGDYPQTACNCTGYTTKETQNGPTVGQTGHQLADQPQGHHAHQ